MKYSNAAKLANGNTFRNALKWIFHAVQQNVRAVPKKEGIEMPPHEIEIVAKPDGGTARDVQHAIERNIGALAVLMPHDHVVAIEVQTLKALIEAAKISGYPETGVEEIHEKAVSVLRSWSYHRGNEIDAKKMKDID